MMDDVLQLGVQQERQLLAASSSFVRRRLPAYGIDLTAADAGPSYVTHLVPVQAPSASLLSYTDDGVFRVHDKGTLSTTGLFKWSAGGPCTSLHSIDSDPSTFISTGRNGFVGWWDMRERGSTQGEPAVTLAAPLRAPYLSSAVSDGRTVAAGTELQGSEATIDIWDARNASAPVLTYKEAHSDDITSLSFHPSVPSVLLSASSDALVAVSDVRQADEDDSVVGVVNTGASVARAGWGGSAQTFAKSTPLDDDDEAASKNALSLPPLGAFYSVSDMQTVGMWEADGFTELLPTRDVRHTNMRPGLAANDEWQTEYVIDATVDARLMESSEGVGLFCGDQIGRMALIEVPHASTASPSQQAPWQLHCLTSGGHAEVVRCLTYDASSYTLYSGGEDGRICAWSLSQGGAEHDAPLVSGTASQSAGDINGAGSKPTHGGGIGPSRNPLKGSSTSSSNVAGRAQPDSGRRSGKPY